MKTFTRFLVVFLLIFFLLNHATAQSAPPPPPDTTADRVYGQWDSFTTSDINAKTLSSPNAITIDSSGNLYLADAFNNRVLYYPAGSTTATRVYGQGGSFVTNTGNKGGLSADSLYNPFGLVLDSSGNLYVSDNYNNRVLFYPAGSTTATRVYGQGGSFTTNTANNGGISADSLDTPRGVSLDSGGNLYVAELYNHRVLYYPAGSTTATRVYGQGGSFTTNTQNKGGITANSLNYPYSTVLDSSDNLYIADMNNNRVLYYPAGSTTATRVYGQGGYFYLNYPGISANNLYYPAGLALDSNGNLYVADYWSNRVLYYPAGSTRATRVYGQGGSFYTGTPNNGGINADSLNHPNFLVLDNNDGLYVTDHDNHRVLYYPAGSTTATLVYGQGGAFNTGKMNYVGISAESLYQPYVMAQDSSGSLYVAEYNNNRVLYYPAGSTIATRVYGQGGAFNTKAANNGGISADSLYQPSGLALDSSDNLYIADMNNNRVLYYPAESTTATRVYGQGGNFATNTVNNGGVSANSLYYPSGLALDSSDNLYVTDKVNSRVLFYPAGSTTATRVYGQGGSFTTYGGNNGGISANSLYTPYRVALDSSGNLYVTDHDNHRVLYYPAGSTTATRVYGQGDDFTTNTQNKGGISANSFYFPRGLALDSSGNLYVADGNNHRVLYFPAGSTTATYVYGQGGSFTINPGNKGGISANSLYWPQDVVLDRSGNLYVADTANNRVLEYFSSDQVAPAVTAFAATSPSVTAAIVVTAFSASDNYGVTGYLITTSATSPTVDDPGWSGAAPTNCTVAGPGEYSLYPWVKDASGNVSSVYGTPATVTVQAHTSASLALSASRVKVGQTVTLTVTVTPLETVSAALSGTVTFKDGEIVLGTAELVENVGSYTASFDFSSDVEGEHPLSAHYGGSTSHASSTSTVVILSVERYKTYLPGLTR